jgi:hypothetical protein
VHSFGRGSARTKLRVTGKRTGIIDRKSLGVSSSQRAEVYHSRGFTPEKRAAFRTIQCRAGGTDRLVEATNAIRAAEGLFFQSSEIDHRSVTAKSGTPDGESVVDVAITAESPTTAPILLMPKPRLTRPRVLRPMSSIGAGLAGL